MSGAGVASTLPGLKCWFPSGSSPRAGVCLRAGSTAHEQHPENDRDARLPGQWEKAKTCASLKSPLTRFLLGSPRSRWPLLPDYTCAKSSSLHPCAQCTVQCGAWAALGLAGIMYPSPLAFPGEGQSPLEPPASIRDNAGLPSHSRGQPSTCLALAARLGRGRPEHRAIPDLSGLRRLPPCRQAPHHPCPGQLLRDG